MWDSVTGRHEERRMKSDELISLLAVLDDVLD